MRTLVFAVGIFALGVSVGIAAPDYERFVNGPFEVRFGAALGPDGREVDFKTYDDLRRAGSCLATSSVAVWRGDRVVDVVCEM